MQFQISRPGIEPSLSSYEEIGAIGGRRQIQDVRSSGSQSEACVAEVAVDAATDRIAALVRPDDERADDLSFRNRWCISVLADV